MSRRPLLAALLCSAAIATCFMPHQLASAAPGQGPDPAKRAEFRQKVLEKFDANGNGQLEPDEREAAKAAMQRRREQGGGKGQGRQAGAADPERRKKMLEKFDTDGDGKLSETERAAAKEARAKRGG
jgi:hypothetical protein